MTNNAIAPNSWFSGRTAVLATMHRKEQVITPLIEANLGLSVVVPTQFDSDRFGTFTREIPRPGSQRDAARAKAIAAMEVTGHTLAIASEGSFSPHPFLPMVAQNRELVLFLDPANQLEVVGETITSDTNFAHQTISSVVEALAFAEKIGFPDHGLVIMPDANAMGDGIKGVIDPMHLRTTVDAMLQRSPNGTLHLETDMRAMYNPTRMRAIAAATENLIQTLQTTCPACAAPGFDRVEYRYGLPCSWCNQPTDLVQAVIWGCQRCSFQQNEQYPNGLQSADPGQCPYCNP
jgi:hypothetical protein